MNLIKALEATALRNEISSAQVALGLARSHLDQAVTLARMNAPDTELHHALNVASLETKSAIVALTFTEKKQPPRVVPEHVLEDIRSGYVNTEG